MNIPKFTVFYSDGTNFSGNPLTLDWIKIPVTQQIIQLHYLLGNQFVVMEGYKEYNHCKENLGLQARGITKFLLMGLLSVTVTPSKGKALPIPLLYKSDTSDAVKDLFQIPNSSIPPL